MPELTEPIESINKQLKDIFGIDTESTKPLFRVVWAADQYEKRWLNYVDGIKLLHPELREVPKYSQKDIDYKGFYVLERLVVVPVINAAEIPENAKSYEPLWVFRGQSHTYVPPAFWAAKFVIDTMYASLGKKSMAKYIDEEAKNPIEKREERIDKLQEELFGDESFLLGRTITGEAVAYTGEPKIEPVKE